MLYLTSDPRHDDPVAERGSAAIQGSTTVTQFAQFGSQRLPYVFEICHDCRGHGRSSAHLGDFTASEVAERGTDWEQDYMSGFYDRSCEPCDGTGKVKVPDADRLTEEQKAELEADDDFAVLDAAEREAERRMGC